QPLKPSGRDEGNSESIQEVSANESKEDARPVDPGQFDCSPTAKTRPTQPLIRFRRPILADESTAGMTDSYETLTLSEVQQLDTQRDADLQLQFEELQLALEEFDEVDEFEEVDEFDDDWEEGVGVDGEWDVEADGYCGGEDSGEEYLDDRD